MCIRDRTRWTEQAEERTLPVLPDRFGLTAETIVSLWTHHKNWRLLATGLLNTRSTTSAFILSFFPTDEEEGRHLSPLDQDLEGDKFLEEWISPWETNLFTDGGEIEHLLFKLSILKKLIYIPRFSACKVIKISTASTTRSHPSWHEDLKRCQFGNQQSLD